jgi:hypothetical protein
VEAGTNRVYSWDPRARRWIHESGDRAPAPPAAPIDIDALQTYFFEADTETWNPTILGNNARRIATELGPRFRGPVAFGLAMVQQSKAPTLIVEQHGQARAPLALWLVGIAAVLIAAVATQTTFLASF